MNRTMLGATTALLLMTGAAFAADADQPGHQSPAPGSNHEAVSATEDAAAALVGTVSAEMTHTTKGFVTAAATSDMYEVEAGHIAMDRGQTQAVKDFGRQMVAAHTKTTDKLKGILASGKAPVTPPAHVDNRRQGMLDNLRGASAADFDHRYIVQQIAAHREADILFSGYAAHGDNQAVKDFTVATDNDIKMHLSMARALDNNIKK
jgi:putative membrane protein